jgi:hypothetical protein
VSQRVENTHLENQNAVMTHVFLAPTPCPALLSSVRQHMITKTVTPYWARIREAEIVDLTKWTNKILGTNRRARTAGGFVMEDYGRRRMEVDVCIQGKMQRQSVQQSTRVMRLIMDK